MDTICPKCGAKSSEKEFINAFCIDCYEFKFKLPKPADFPVVICKRCGKMLFKGEWSAFDPTRVADKIQRRVKGEHESAEFDFETKTLSFRFQAGGKERTFVRLFDIPVQNGICPDCSRMSGGYFEAIVQLRGENQERLRQFAASLEKRLSDRTFISKVEEPKEGGIDLYIGSSKAVVSDFASRGVKALLSRKLFGKDKEGRTVYRTTFLVRL